MKNESPGPVRLSVSIVLYLSSVDLLVATLSSLYRAALSAINHRQLSSVEVTLVDNSQCTDYRSAVQDAIAGLETAAFITISYTEAPKNNGFGVGHNQVLPQLKSAIHLILNPDVELDEAALCAGLRALKNDASLALVSPKVLAPSGSQEFLCKSYPSVLVLLLRASAPFFIRSWFRKRLDSYELRRICTRDQPAEVMLVSGCFMLMRTAGLLKIKGFSEKYFLYFEDFDLSLRLRGQGQLLYLPTMQITHHGGYAAGKGGGHVRLFIKSGYQFFNDHGWKWI